MGSWSRKQRILLPYTFLRGTHVQTYAHVHVYAGHTGVHFFLLSVYRKYKGDCLRTKSHSRQTKSIVTCRIAGEVFVCSEFYPPVEFHSCDKQVGQKTPSLEPQLGHSSVCRSLVIPRCALKALHPRHRLTRCHGFHGPFGGLLLPGHP